MTKALVYQTVKDIRSEGGSWLDALKETKKKKLVSNYVDIETLKSIYREVAGDIETYGTTKEQNFDDQVASFFNFIGKTRKNIERTKIEKQTTAEDISIVISDVHVPYHDLAKMQRVVDETKSFANRLIIAGDFLNGTQISSHPQVIHEDFQKELAQGRLVLEWLAADYDEVILVDDNHVHSRWQKYLAHQMRPDLHFLTMHPYDYMTAGLPNVKRAKNVNPGNFPAELGWLYKIGDAVFTHAELSATDPFKVTKTVKDYLARWEPVYKLGNIRLIGQAHNHNVGVLHGADSMELFTGCMLSMDAVKYSMSAKCSGKPPVHGYVILVQNDGVTDLEKTRVQRIAL